MPKLKDITLREYLDAMKKNGYRQKFGGLFARGHGGEIYACAVGQARLNLGLIKKTNGAGSSKSGRYYPTSLCKVINSKAISMNDTHFMPISIIEKALREEYAEKLDEIMYERII